ncbi:MAG: ATP-binding cassette domain-containing protein [Neisseriaceae bacterium]|nr:MAG: ATP-binding cassette domain-containing protein [Neisseriaceae bacterium]
MPFLNYQMASMEINKMSEILLEVNNLSINFYIPKKGSIFTFKKDVVTAVNNVSFQINKGEVFGIVGESGSGKSTIARAIIGLNKITSGSVQFNQQELTNLTTKSLRLARKDMRMIFQDPLASLSPRMTLGNIIAEPLKIYQPELTKLEIKQKVEDMLEKVGLSKNMVNRYPHEFSGGQCQRIGIARALIVKPKLLICDEPTTALDMCIQAQIIELLKKMNREFNMAILLITHDLRVVAGMCEHVLVLQHGQKVEYNDTLSLFCHPKQQYTKQLLTAIPRLPS